MRVLRPRFVRLTFKAVQRTDHVFRTVLCLLLTPIRDVDRRERAEVKDASKDTQESFLNILIPGIGYI